ncbi:MAG: RNA polymerase sigma factor [Steroidobacteraceae bacterium]
MQLVNDAAAKQREHAQLARGKALEIFLADIERRAYRIALLGLRNEDDALDAVQESMLSLVKNYASRPQAEWKPLFYRILTNRMHDMRRRRASQSRFMAWWPLRAGADEDAEDDPVAAAPDPGPLPAERIDLQDAMERLEQSLTSLPARQQEAFLLRSLEGLDVAATAAAMGCSEGSVKTHYFRALQSLRIKLGDFSP